MLLKGDIDIELLGNGKELGTQGGRVNRFAAHRKLDAAFALVGRQAFGNATGKAVDLVDIEAVMGGDFTDPGNVLSGYAPRQQRNDVTWFPLAAHPLAVFVGADGRKLDLLIQLIAFEQYVLEHICLTRHFHQDTKRQGVMDHRLADVENIDLGLCQYAGNGSRQTGAVRAGNIDQHDFLQGDALQDCHSNRRPNAGFESRVLYPESRITDRDTQPALGGRSSMTLPSGSSR